MLAPPISASNLRGRRFAHLVGVDAIDELREYSETDASIRPSWSEMPEVFNVAFVERASQPDVILGSKAVGEPPLMLAISVREAIRDAIAA